MTKKVILASASPRRKELLKQMGISYEVIVPDIDEESFGLLPPNELVQTLAQMKAQAVANTVEENSLVIAADTVVVLEGQILGKPKDELDAKQMLNMLSGKAHMVYTGVAIVDPATNRQERFVVDTKIYMKVMSQEEIDAYILTGEPLDKAGSYGIQGRGGVFIERIEGDYFSVMGLPIARLYDLLKKFIEYDRL